MTQNVLDKSGRRIRKTFWNRPDPPYAESMTPTAPRRTVRPASIHDVARAAEVSITTVSHALNGKGVVAEATRRRVVDAAARLGYQADALARGLRNNRIGAIGLVMRPLDALGSYRPEGVDYFIRFAGAAAVESLDRGQCLMLIRDLTSGSIPAIAFAVDGYVVADPIANDPVLDLLLGRGIPVVSVGRDIGRNDFVDWVGADERVESRMVLDHLRSQGARRIALVVGTDLNAWNLDTEAHYRRWAEENRMETRIIRRDESSGEEGGRSAARELLALEDAAPDAVYCLTGRHAAGLLTDLQSAGRRTPEDVMVVAGSDSEQTRNSTPPITSVDLRPELVAQAAIELITGKLGDPAVSGPILIQSELLVRGTTRRSPAPLP